MKSPAYLLVFDGLADWEPALAACELHKRKDLEVVPVGFAKSPVRTMGGLTVTPAVTLAEVDPARARVFLLPGGDRWEKASSPELIGLLQRLEATGVPIGAICGATLEVARAGLLRDRRHTSNALAYLRAQVPDYGGEAHYVEELAVTDRGVITASGAGHVEFAREIITLLRLYTPAETQQWFALFKHGVLPGS